MTDQPTLGPADRPLSLPDDWPALRIPRRLTAVAPGWSTSADVIVVGSGIAGLSCALRRRRPVDRVLLVTEGALAGLAYPATWRGNTSALRAGDGSIVLTFAYAAVAAAAHETSDPTLAEPADPIKEDA